MVMIASNGFWLGTVLLFNWVQWMVMAVADSLSTPAPFYGIKRSELLQERINTECNDCIPRWPSGYVSYILMHMIKRWDIFTWNREKNEMNGLDSRSTAYWIWTVLLDWQTHWIPTVNYWDESRHPQWLSTGLRPREGHSIRSISIGQSVGTALLFAFFQWRKLWWLNNCLHF